MKNVKLIIFVMMGMIIFLIDIMTEVGSGEWLFYIVFIFLYITNSGNKKNTPLLGLIYAIFMMAGFLLSPVGKITPKMPFFNLMTGAVVLALFVVIGNREIETRKITYEIIERIKDLFIALDKKCRIIYFNRNAREITGVNEDVIDKNIFEVLPLEEDSLQPKLDEAIKTGEPVRFMYSVDDSKTHLDVSIYASKRGYSVYAKNVTEKVLTERKLINLLEEKEMLMKEMQHRTKNNFQLLISLLNLQINSITDQNSINILNETVSRLRSIHLLYDKLFKTGDYYSVELSSFIKDLLINSHNNYLRVEKVRIGVQSAIPIGLIINELYTNSQKYAFTGTPQDTIEVIMKFIDDETLYILYRDNGKGLPEGFDIKNGGGLGSTIISAFVEQFDGEISCRNNNGAEFEMKLKVPKHQKENFTFRAQEAEICRN